MKWFQRARSKEHPVMQNPAEICDICGGLSLDGFRRCERHLGIVFDSHAVTDAPETRGA